jgi:hypothetical protein
MYQPNSLNLAQVRIELCVFNSKCFLRVQQYLTHAEKTVNLKVSLIFSNQIYPFLESSSSTGSKTGALRLRKTGAASSSGNVPTPQLPLNLTNFVKFFESSSVAFDDSGSPNYVNAFGPGAYVTVRFNLNLNHQIFSVNVFDLHVLPILTHLSPNLLL